MRKVRIFVLALLLGGGLYAQPFLSHPIHVAEKGDSLNIQWGDLNGDGLLDSYLVGFYPSYFAHKLLWVLY